MLVATRPYRIFAFGMIFQNCDAKIVTIIHFPKSPPQLLTKFEGVYMKGKFMKEGTGRVPAGDDIIVNPRRSAATPGDRRAHDPPRPSPHRGRHRC